METKEFELNLYQDIENFNSNNILPFNNYINEYDDNNFFDFLNIDFPIYETKIYCTNSDQIIDKINKIEENYKNIINDNISSPTSSIYWDN